MKKVIPIIVSMIIVLGGLNALAINVEKKNNFDSNNFSKTMELDFLSPKIIQHHTDYLMVTLGDEETYLINPSQPMLPKIVKTFEGQTHINSHRELQ